MNKEIKIKYIKHKEIINNYFWRAIQMLGKRGATFFAFVLCAKYLSANDFGVYNYIMSVFFLLIIFGDFGISSATSKHITEYSVKNKKKLKRVVFNSLLLIFALSAVAILITLFIGKPILKDKYSYVLLILPMVFLAPASSLYDGIYRGLKKFKQLTIIFLFSGAISLVFIFFLIKYFGLVGAFISQILFYFISVVTLFCFYRKIEFKFESDIIKKISKYSIVLGISSLGYYLYNGVDALILGQFNYFEEINYFRLYAKIMSIMVIPFSIFGQVIAPDITIHLSKNNTRKILNKFIKYSFFSFVLSVAITLFIYIIGPIVVSNFLPNLYSDKFLDIFNLLIWTAPFILLLGVVSHFIVSTGKIKIGLTTIPFGILNVVLNFFFITRFGFIGVAYSTLAVVILNAISTWLLLFYSFSSRKFLNQ